jgi:hypothetical protein
MAGTYLLGSGLEPIDFGRCIKVSHPWIHRYAGTILVGFDKNSYQILASKTFAEKAAWDFMKEESPDFTLTTINPTLVFGPIVSAFYKKY